MAIVKHKAGTTTPPLFIWAETTNINYYLKTALTPVTDGGVVNKQVNVSAHSRRQYPGDPPPVNVSAASREFMHDPGARSGAALPGKNFWLVADEGLPAEERRQFTFVGRFVDLHAFLAANAKYASVLYSPAGKRYTFPAATAGP